MLEVNSQKSTTQRILSQLDEARRSVEVQQRNLCEQIEAFSKEGADAAKSLAAAELEVRRLTARVESMNNGRAACARTASKTDFSARILASIQQGLAGEKTADKLDIQSADLGQGGADPRMMTMALDELRENLAARGVPVSVACRVSESSGSEEKLYLVEWSFKSQGNL